MAVERAIPIEDGQIDEAATVLARAFWSEPLQQRLIPDPRLRERFYVHQFRAVIEHGGRFGRVWVISDPPRGVAIWFASEAAALSASAQKESGLSGLAALLPGEVAAQFVAIGRWLREIRSRIAPESHLHLWGIGVAPECQRHGLGSALLAPALRDADATQVACYVETFTESNLEFYERHGFEIVSRRDEPITALPVWFLVRPPG